MRWSRTLSLVEAHAEGEDRTRRRERDPVEPDVIRTCTALEPGRCDRSPCGTVSSGRV